MLFRHDKNIKAKVAMQMQMRSIRCKDNTVIDTNHSHSRSQTSNCVGNMADFVNSDKDGNIS